MSPEKGQNRADEPFLTAQKMSPETGAHKPPAGKNGPDFGGGREGLGEVPEPQREKGLVLWQEGQCWERGAGALTRPARAPHSTGSAAVPGRAAGTSGRKCGPRVSCPDEPLWSQDQKGEVRPMGRKERRHPPRALKGGEKSPRPRGPRGHRSSGSRPSPPGPPGVPLAACRSARPSRDPSSGPRR